LRASLINLGNHKRKLYSSMSIISRSWDFGFDADQVTCCSAWTFFFLSNSLSHTNFLPFSRWSAIASRLPGRTDNEIKNVWHTHLLKRLKQNGESKSQQHIRIPDCHLNDNKLSQSASSTVPSLSGCKSIEYAQMSPQPSSSDHSSVTDTSVTTSETNNTGLIKLENIDSSEIYPVIDEDFWSEPEMVENSGMPSSNFLDDSQFPFPSPDTMETAGCYGYGPKVDDNMEFWYNLFIKSGGIEELPVQYLQRYSYLADERIWILWCLVFNLFDIQSTWEIVG